MSPNLSNANTCPEHLQLLALAEGTLSEEEATSVTEHISQCQTCDMRLGAIEEQSDALIRALSSLPASPEDEATFQTLQAKLLATPERFGDDAEETTAAFLGEILSTKSQSIAFPVRLGNYELLEQIGAGANGAVFRAIHRRLQKQVAIKLLLNVARSAVEEFLNEMRIIGQLNHPNIVEATDAGEHDGVYFLVMEYVPGLDASSLLRQTGPLRIAEACEIARQAAVGLRVAHENRLVHRDVKTSNLLLTASGQVKLLDLGLATIAALPNGSANHSPASGPRGTADYMAPEQWREASSVTPRADLYSLGCTLYKLLTGVPPFRSLPDGVSSLEAAHLNCPMPPLAGQTLEKVPAALESYLRGMLAKDPEDRPSSAKDVAATMARYAQQADLHGLARKLFPDAEIERTVETTTSSTTALGATTRRLALTGMLAGLAAVAWRVNHPKAPQRQIRSNQWRPLLPTTLPVVPVIDNRRSDLNRSASPVAEAIGKDGLRIQSNGPVLVHLGKPISSSYHFRITLSRDEWETTSGVFFCLRSDRTGKFQFQTLELGESESGVFLTWNQYTIPIQSPVALAGIDLPYARSSQYELELGLGASGFPELTINGQRVPEAKWTISKEGRELITTHTAQLASTVTGYLGVFHNEGEVTVQSPELAYLSERNRS